MTVGVIFVTHNAEHHLPYCLPPILSSPLKPRVLVMNSSSQDGTLELAKDMGAETLLIPRKEFNHGLSREKARRYLNTDIIVMMTPDAYAQGSSTLETLIKPILEKKASIAYARQVPHDGAGFFEAFSREFNYPSQSHIRSYENRHQYGIYTIFCSNSCAAYDNHSLDEVGGFTHTLIGEDTFTTAKLLKQGRKIAYVAEAVIKHSHEYNLHDEFRRNFDTGLARKWNNDLLKSYASDEKRGKQYTAQMLKKLMNEEPRLIPYAILQTGIKYFGYCLGKSCAYAPNWIKKRCSSQDFYWQSVK